MAMILRAKPLPQGSCRRPRHRTACVVPKATSVLYPKQPFDTASAMDSASRQRAGSSHYVNFAATAADYSSVLGRLEAASSLSPEARSAMSVTAPGAQATERKSWSVGFMGGLFGGKQQQAEVSAADLSVDDGSPLCRAVVMFTATWCGPCSIVYRELTLAAGRLQGRPPTAILVVDVEEEKDLASELGIKALPTLLYMSPDNSRGPVFSQGPVSASFILDALDRAAGFGGRDVKAKWLKL
ncbi:hypothetical protein PLESTM_001647800 [Pleodorina starrii]|nr:hypothetical protein PLESTM_001647800 [Pleodorina starrii]